MRISSQAVFYVVAANAYAVPIGFPHGRGFSDVEHSRLCGRTV